MPPLGHYCGELLRGNKNQKSLLSLLLLCFLGDLPPILRAMIESVGSHQKWCDHMQNNPHLTPEARENLHRQKAVLGQQIKLVNEQIHLHRVSLP